MAGRIGIVALAAAAAAWPQGMALRGVVRNIYGEPVAGARVALVPGGASATTGADGAWSLQVPASTRRRDPAHRPGAGDPAADAAGRYHESWSELALAAYPYLAASGPAPGPRPETTASKLGAAPDSLEFSHPEYRALRLPLPGRPDSVPATLERRIWRAFKDASPWNTPIPANPTLDPGTGALVEDLATSTEAWNFLGINIVGFGLPVYYIDSAKCPAYMFHSEALVGEGLDRPVPVPDYAKPDSSSDAHLILVDKGRMREWGIYDANKRADGWHCWLGAVSDLRGTGVRPAANVANPWTLAHGPRASGFAGIAGIIRVEDIDGGAIEHALVVAYPHCRSRYFVPPASTAQATNGMGADSTRGIPMGGRIQLDPALNVDSLPLSRSGKIIARALQKYGAYVGDYSGAINLYAEAGDAAMQSATQGKSQWDNGKLGTYEIRDVFNQSMLRRFRVLKLPPLINNGN